MSLSQCTCYVVRRQGLKFSPGWVNPLCYIVVLSVGEGSGREHCCSLVPLYPQFPMNPCETGSLSCCSNPHSSLQLALCFSLFFSQPCLAQAVRCLAMSSLSQPTSPVLATAFLHDLSAQLCPSY